MHLLPSTAIRISKQLPDDDSEDRDWTVVLAGSDGAQISSYIQSRFGQRIPKPYLRLNGARSMLEQTLDRLNQLTPAARTLTVIGPQHLAQARAQVIGRSDHVVCQPAARDTGFGLFIALAMIRRWAPNAVVTIAPAGHHVAPARSYLHQVAAARRLAAVLRDKVVVLGVEPGEPDTDLDYLQLGEQVHGLPHVHQLVNLIGKPTPSAARQLEQSGALWSTSGACSTVDALWELGRATEPRLIDILDSLIPLVGTPDEDDAIDYIYRAYLPISFTRDMIAGAPWRCVTWPLHGVEWSDAGSPVKLAAVLGEDTGAAFSSAQR